MSKRPAWDERRLGRYLKLRDLNMLLTVTRCGSMGKAAAQLAVSQPAISKAIADMEYSLGVRLLDRGPHGVEPTVYGRTLLDHGLNAFDELKQAVQHIEFLADPTAGEVRVGASVIIGSSFVTTVVDRLSRRHPGITVHLLSAEAAMTYRALEEREVELLIAGIFEPVAAKHMDAEILYDDPFVVAAGARNPWCRRRQVRLADLMNEPWTLPPTGSLTRPIVDKVFHDSGLEVPRATLVASSIPVRNALVASGRFLTLVPASVLQFAAGNREMRAVPVKIPTHGRPIGILTLKNRTLSAVAQLFIACAREVAQSAVGRPHGARRARP